MNLNRILEIFGVNGDSSVRVGERPSCDDCGKTPIYLTAGNATTVNMSVTEARYLAERLTYLADKITKKRKALSQPDDDE